MLSAHPFLYAALVVVLFIVLVVARTLWANNIVTRTRRPRTLLTNRDVIFYIALIIAICLGAFLYFRATFPH